MSAIAQRSFQGGEISPSFYAHTDLTKYQTGLRVCRNMIVRRGGGVTNRAGTCFIKEVKDSSVGALLKEFSYSDAETYLLEFGNGYVRFYQNGVPLAPVGVVPWIAIVYTAGSLVSYLGSTYYAKVLTTTGNPAANPTYWYLLPDPAILEIPTPYSTAQLSDLQFVQSRHIMTIVHPSVPVYELSRSGATGWTMLAASFVPETLSPTSLAIGAGGIAGARTYWAVTAAAEETFEESLPALVDDINKVPSAGAPVALSWSGFLPAPKAYNIYRSTDGATYGYVGSSSSTSFSDVGTIPDFFHSFPLTRDVFNAANKYPASVTNYQQRRLFGRTNTELETIWASRTGQPKNFGITFPLQDDDAVTFTMTGRRANPVKHMMDLGRLVVFTEREEKMVEGDDAGILRPDAVNPRKLSANGAGRLRPLEIDDSAVYVQARGTIVRDLKPVSADQYQGTDLTVFAHHLFDGYTLSDWDYAQNPHSVVWAARSDGTILGLTYLKDHAIWGWHRHDTDGIVENVCVVPEGSEDKVYMIVRRTINGATKRYIERMATRTITDITRAVFTDCSYPADRASDSPSVLYTITLSGGTNWNETETLTATKTAGPAFSAGDVNNSLFLTASDGTEVEFRINGYTDATHVTGHVDKTVPSDLRGLPTSSVIKGVLTMTGLSHLEGKAVSVFADGYVVASPNNVNGGYASLTVTGGQITLPRPYKFVRVGLPYISDLVTLDIDSAGSSTIKPHKLIVNRVGLWVEESRGIWVGMPSKPTAIDPLNGLQEYKARQAEDYNDPVALKTDYIEVTTEARYDENGRVLIRQVDPLPLSVLAIIPIFD